MKWTLFAELFLALNISAIAQQSTSSGTEVIQVLLSILMFILTTLVLFALCLPLLRFVLVPISRLFGFYNPKHFYLFTRIGIPWRFFYRPLLKIKHWVDINFKDKKQAAARWASLLEAMSLVYKSDQIFLGRLSAFGIPLFQPVGINGNSGRHISMIAGVGSGKTTMLMTMLALHDGNAFVIDCDAQMYNSLYRRMGAGGNGIFGKGKKIYLLDPYNQAVDGDSACWNPIEEIDVAVDRGGKKAAVDVAKTLADALIRITDGTNEWVYTAARSFLTGLILYVWQYEPPEQRNLLRLRELLTIGLRDYLDPAESAGYDPFDILLEVMKTKDDFDGIIAQSASILSGESGSHDSDAPRKSAIDQTFWISLPHIAATLKHSDFKCEDLKISDASLFIVAPVTDIQGKLSGWVRVLTRLTMEAFQKTPEKPKSRCFFVIDEMPSLGRIEIFVSASAVFRKYQVRLLTVTQDIGLLQKTYPKEWETFLGNSECIIWMATNHLSTLDYLSKILGKTTIKEYVERKHMFSREKVSVPRQDRELMTAEQLGRFLSSNIIVTRYGERPLKLKNAPYYKELPVYYYEVDSYYGDTFWRAHTRSLFQKWYPKPEKTVSGKVMKIGTDKSSSTADTSEIEKSPYLEKSVGTEYKPSELETSREKFEETDLAADKTYTSKLKIKMGSRHETKSEKASDLRKNEKKSGRLKIKIGKK